MKISSEWVHQPDVDQTGDAILAEGKATLDTITAYQVADRLDRSANPSMYAKFRDWRARRRAEAEPVSVDVPPEVEANIRAIFARLSDDGVGACLDAVRIVGGSLDRASMLRVGDAERHRAKAEAETAEVVTIGERIETELRAATIRITELEQALANAQRREDRLAGRLEQREADLAALQSRARMDASTTNTASAARSDDAHVIVTTDIGGGINDDGDTHDGSGNADSTAQSDQAVAIPVAQLRLTFAGVEVDNVGGDDAR